MRFYAHLPRWRVDPRSWSLGVTVTEGTAVVATIDPMDHRPAFIPLEPGRHELTITFMGAFRDLTKFDLVVNLQPGQVVEAEHTRPKRWRAVGRSRRPTGVTLRG